MSPTHDPNRRLGSPVQQRQDMHSPTAANRRAHPQPARMPLMSNNSSIRIRRLTSATSRTDDTAIPDHESIGGRSSTDETSNAGRRRSFSAPQQMSHLTVPPNISRIPTSDYHPDMPAIAERTPGASTPTTPATNGNQLQAPRPAQYATRPRGLSDLHAAGGSGLQAAYGAGNTARANRGLSRMRTNTMRSRPIPIAGNEYDERVLGLLDLVGKCRPARRLNSLMLNYPQILRSRH